MANSIAIIGSFRKYYEQVSEIITYFTDSGYVVQSPSKSKICKSIEKFVVFESDNPSYTPAEIQMITLNKILSSDAIYVYNPDGYIGRTTCYEIGVCLTKKKPVYFYQQPNDLPIPVDNKQILTPEDFVVILKNNNYEFFSDYAMCEYAKRAFTQIFDVNDAKVESRKDLVICGSMQFYDEMVKCQKELNLQGIDCVIPKEENDMINLLSEKQFLDFKRKVSSAYLKIIRSRNTSAVLILNIEKNGKENYIGANTLVELAMAFSWKRKIFLYNDIYEPLRDELVAWECICLNGDLNKITKYMERKKEDIDNDYQLTLF